MKTSDWIIQEIGLAIGRGIDIILLKEEGLRDPGGLQGDLEYIKFNRNEPEKSYSKILEMIKSLKPKITSIDKGRVEKFVEKKNEKELVESESKIDLEVLNNWEYKDYSFALSIAIFTKNEDKEKEIYEKYLKTDRCKEKYEQIKWKAELLYLRHLFLKDDTLKELKELLKEYPLHVEVNNFIGEVYNRYKDYNKAAVCFNVAAENSKNKKEKIQWLCKAALAFSKNCDESKSKFALEQVKNIKDSIEEGEIVLLKTLSEISEIENDEDNYLAFNEALVDLNPEDHNRRFSLAYKYADLDKNDNALYHYKIIVEHKPDESEWNNIGAAEDNLELPYKSYVAYKKSEELGGTLAMSNIAHKLINAGFLKEAEEICNRAVKIPNHDKQIGTAISRIREVKIDEDKKEKEILDKTKSKRSFLIDYAHAYTKINAKEFQGLYSSLYCNLNIKIQKEKFEAFGCFEKKSDIGLLNLISGSNIYSNQSKNMFVRYSGVIKGHSVKFKHWITEKENFQQQYDSDSKEGLMIISDDFIKIKVFEKGNRDEEKFYDLILIE